jgi:hypothetical protein
MHVLARALRDITSVSSTRRSTLVLTLLAIAIAGTWILAASTSGGPLPPLFPSSNWWNLDVSAAPVDPASAAYISFIGSTRRMHPDFGGNVSTGSIQT